jgi:hypothetical protein
MTEETEVCHFTDSAEIFLPSLHITLIDKSISSNGARQCPIPPKHYFTVIQDKEVVLPDVIDCDFINFYCEDLSINMKTDKSLFMNINPLNHEAFFIIIQKIIENSCNNYNVNVYLFFNDIKDEFTYTAAFNSKLLEIYDNIYNNVFIVNYLSATETFEPSINNVIVNCVYIDGQKKFLKVIMHKTH